MNAKRKFATLTAAVAQRHKEEIHEHEEVEEEEELPSGNIVPVLVHNPNAGPGEPEYVTEYATFATEEEANAVSSIHRGHHIQQIHHDGQIHHHQLADNEIIIDEHGRAVTIQQLVNEDCNNVEEVEAVEESDGVLRIVSGLEHHQHHETSVGSNEEMEDGEIYQEEDGASGSRNNRQFYCTNCGNCYSAAGSLKLHMRACLRQRQEVPIEERKCNLCQKVFNSVSYLKEHMLRHTGDGPRRCTRCYRKFVDDAKYDAHMESHKQQDKLEAEAEILAAEHGGRKVTIKEFTCSFCSQNFTVVFEMNQVRKRYACDACREKYSNAETLKQHKQMIDDKREFHCERCGRKFVFEGFLQRHLPTCDGTIKRRRDLK